jgi:acyl-CoA reductase-like NAD-dependent aldehyde dehydrogenase
VDLLRTQAGRGIPMGINSASTGRLAFTQHEPIGPVVAFSAFNHPVNLIVHQIAPAVAAGAPFVVKPAEATPLSCMRVVAILREAGLPEEWGQALVTTDFEVSGRLVSDARVGFFSFIGSGRVGWMLRSQLAPGTRCALEHGGAAPVVVGADADLSDVVPLLTRGGFYHAGQVCVSVQRVFAHRSLASDLARRLAEAAGGLRVGDPTLSETDVGPLIRPTEVERVATWVDEAVAGGAEALCGARAHGDRGYAPTVLLEPPPDARVSTLEVFGPVVCVYAYDDLDDAIARANALPFSFQAAVFTRDIETAVRAARRLDAATVLVNDHTAFRVDWMPFAGHRESGYGTGGIPFTFEDMQAEKLIVIRSAEL